MEARNWRTYTFEFLSIFVAVVSAFALNNWNENRRDHRAETKILTEILHGLEKDIEDVRLNVWGHEQGLNACAYFRRVVLTQETNVDSFQHHYFYFIRDFISVQNTSGYETLKSRGLELIRNDSLRTNIISLYEYDYNTLKTLEEEYYELQFQKNYYQEMNHLLAPHLQFDERGNITGLELPLGLSNEDKQLFLSYLWKIGFNRNWVLGFYQTLEEKIMQLQQAIKDELKRS
ncbi:MAG: hypothetical protein AAFZ63_26530 [Bacteroidota bacterium]